VRLTILVNDLEGLETRQTTALLARSAALRHEVFLCGVCDLSRTPDGAVVAAARRAPYDTTGSDWDDRVRSAPPELVELDGVDVLLMRTNPGRDHKPWAHETAMCLAELLTERGVLVLNDPNGLRRASSKLYLSFLPPETSPATLVSRDRDALRDFVRESERRSVLKPLAGSRGQGVFVVKPKDPNLNVILDLLTAEGFCVAQECAEGSEEGDTRAILIDGQLLEVDDRIAAVRRVPGRLEFRSNVHAGGKPAPAELTRNQLAVISAVGPRLAADGLFLTGLDLVGDKIVEVNVFSPGGLQDANTFAGVDYAAAVIRALEARLARHRT